jgi:hypothetical protein
VSPPFLWAGPQGTSATPAVPLLVVMVAPPEVPRYAKGRAKGRSRKTRGQRQYKGRSPVEPGTQMAMGRIEHTLLDEGRASSPTDLRPSPATPPYHRK